MREFAKRRQVPPVSFVSLILLLWGQHGWCQLDIRKEALIKGAEAAAETYVKDTSHTNTKFLLDFAKQEMLKHPAANKSPQQAEPAIRKIIDQQFQDYIEKQIKSAYISLVVRI
jgi:hypothetical protein